MLGLFHRVPSVLPRHLDRGLASELLTLGAAPYDGPSELAPGVRERLDAALTQLVTLRFQDQALARARQQRQRCGQAAEVAAAEAARVELTETPRVTAGRAARAHSGPNARHARSDGGRALVRITDAAQRNIQAQTDAQQAIDAHLGALYDTTDRMYVAARAAVTQVEEFLTLLNRVRDYEGQPRLGPLPEDLAERLVLRASHAPTPVP